MKKQNEIVNIDELNDENIKPQPFVCESIQEVTYNEPKIPVRSILEIQKGQIYIHKTTKNKFQLIEIIKYNQGLFKNIETNVNDIFSFSEFENVKNAYNENIAYDIQDITSEQWQRAQDKYSAIKPLLDSKNANIGEVNIKEYAAECGVSVRTLLRWKAQYLKTNTLISLLDKSGGWERGNSRLLPEVEQIIQDVIENDYLTERNTTVRSLILKVHHLCHLHGLPKPNHNSIRLRIERIPEKDILKKRGKSALARKKYMPTAGTFPNADYPLRVIQIDHTPADVILVDDVYRKPIGRPYITVAIDVYSRMIVGYYISLDAPSVTSVAMCIARAVLPKDDLLREFDIQGEWNGFGMPHTIHVDNGADFKSDDLKKSCALYGINLEFRPMARPHYGGHIERLIGTLMQETHELDGTTFSNIKERDEYQSEKKAALTLAEYEKWLLNYIVRIYHNRVHSATLRTPNEQYRIGIYGDDRTTGCGIPKLPSDALTFIIDFLPSFRRTIQNTGINLDSLRYYDPCLNVFINSIDENKEKKKFTVRRDPRDISYIWFFDPVLKQYFKVPLANQNLPAMSLWEYNTIRNHVKATNGAVNESLIYQAWEDMRAIEQEARSKTLKQRRAEQRRLQHQKSQVIYDKATSLSTPDNPVLGFSPAVAAKLGLNDGKIALLSNEIELAVSDDVSGSLKQIDEQDNGNAPVSSDDYFDDIDSF